MPRFRIASFAAFLVLVGACAGDGPNTPTEPDDDGPGEPVVKANPSFADDVMEIFQRRGCTATDCHAAAAGGLLMTDAATAYGNLLRRPSSCQGIIRVLPGVPDSSFLVMKVEGTHPCGARMPRGDEPLNTIDMTNIRNWVLQNALNN